MKKIKKTRSPFLQQLHAGHQHRLPRRRRPRASVAPEPLPRAELDRGVPRAVPGRVGHGKGASMTLFDTQFDSNLILQTVTVIC